MPHKRNPWRLENVSGIARVMRGYASTALENQALWHERDISNSSVERFIFPDACVTLDFTLHRMAGLVESLVVFPERMQANLDSTRGLAFSGTLLLALAEKGLTREQSYALVQGHAMDTWDHGGALRDRIVSDDKITAQLSPAEIDRAFSLDEALRHVDAIFHRTLANKAEPTS
jgi:adenylosuccinate lyase